MFSEEVNVSKVYSLSNRELLYTHSKMWASCTEAYDGIFTTEANAKIQKILEYRFINDSLRHRSKEKYINIYYNDAIDKISITFAQPTSILRINEEWINLLAELDINSGIRETLNDLHGDASGFIQNIILDVNGNTTGFTTNKIELNSAHQTTALGELYENLSNNTATSDCKMWIEHQKDSDNTIVHTSRSYSLRNYSFTSSNNKERKITVYNPTKVERNKQEYVNYWLETATTLNLITEDDGVWIKSLIDHQMQEIDLSFVFDADKTLIDVLVYKREVKEFKVWRT